MGHEVSTYTLQLSLGRAGQTKPDTCNTTCAACMSVCQNYLAHRQQVHTAVHDVPSNLTVTHPHLQLIHTHCTVAQTRTFTHLVSVHIIIVSLENKMVNTTTVYMMLV